MDTSIRYKCGDIITNHQRLDLTYGVKRRLISKDTEVGLYVAKRVNDNTELLKNAKLIDNPACFSRCAGDD